MGNCCPKRSEEQQTLTATGRPVRAFQGEGQRLGTMDQGGQQQPQNATRPASNKLKRDEDATPAPAVDPNLTEQERAQIRADRAAAAEARLQKQGGTTQKKKKPVDKNTPLRGPNSEPLMRWNA